MSTILAKNIKFPTTDAPKKLPRDRKKEDLLAQTRQVKRVLDIVDAKFDGKLGDEYIKLAQAMILCTLPISATHETKITRQARLGDGSTLYVTFSAAHHNVGMPFGADRKVLAWIFDKAIRSETPFIPWSSAVEFQKEMGLTKGGKNNRDLHKRFERVAGLVISIQREAGEGKRDLTYPLIERSYLPPSITGKKLDNGMQQSLPELADRYGFAMNPSLFNDIRKHHIVLPRRLWAEIKGPTAIQDLVFWLIFRCYSAASETIIPWKALTDQFPQDSNPHRNRLHTRQAIRTLKALWPGVQIEEVPQGIKVDRAKDSLLEDDAAKGRIRRLPVRS